MQTVARCHRVERGVLAALLATVSAAAQAGIGPVQVPRSGCVRVLDGAGDPVPGAELRLLDAAGVPFDEVLARSGADGFARFALFGESADEPLPTLQIARPGRATQIVVVDLRAHDTGRAPGDLGDVALFPGESLRGRVADETGEPLAGVLITARSSLVVAASGLPRCSAAPRPAVPGPVGPVPEPWVAVRSDARGAFQLLGVPASGVFVHAARPGFETVQRGPLMPGAPLEIALRRTGYVRGRLVNETGAPVRGLVELRERSGFSVPAVVGDDGRFELPLASAASYVVQPIVGRVDCPLPASQRGPVDGLQVVAAAAAPIGLSVVAVDADTGAPLEGVRCAVTWEHPSSVRPEPLDVRRAPLGGGLSPPAELSVPGQVGNDTLGVLLVTAPGHAPVVQLVRWLLGRVGTEVRMRPAASCRGVVVDADSGAPVAGAEVSFGPWSVRDRGLLCTRTEENGSFLLDGLPIGSGQLVAVQWGRPESKPLPVELESGECRDGLRLELARGQTVTGRFIDPGAVRGAWVVLRGRPEPPRWLDVEKACFAAPEDPLAGAIRLARVAADGSFVLPGVTAGFWNLLLLPPRSTESAPPTPLLVRRLRPTDAGADLGGLDVDALRPALVVGRVELHAGELPRGRIAVRARPSGALVDAPGAWLPPDLPAVVVRSDGTFALPLNAGRFALSAVDLAAGGLELARLDPVEVIAGERCECLLEASCGEVSIRIEPPGNDPAFTGCALWLAPSGARLGGWMDLRGRASVLDVLAPRGRLELRLFGIRPALHVTTDAVAGATGAIETLIVASPSCGITLRFPRWDGR
ncbi:MAG: hypothetical protein IPM29_29445 [Planctomycetes bacterium]|nr:hypothetical protein [Planctomycetota bacterium]